MFPSIILYATLGGVATTGWKRRVVVLWGSRVSAHCQKVWPKRCMACVESWLMWNKSVGSRLALAMAKYPICCLCPSKSLSVAPL
jgi:hypothetical protein